jgi:hypothetical protein
VSTRHPERELNLASGAQKAERLLEEETPNAAAAKVRSDPHAAEEGSLGRLRALDEDHTNRNVGRECHEYGAI